MSGIVKHHCVLYSAISFNRILLSQPLITVEVPIKLRVKDKILQLNFVLFFTTESKLIFAVLLSDGLEAHR